METKFTTETIKINGGEPTKNGLKCPKCDADLLDTTPNIVLTSDPAQKNTNCSKCDYVGYRFV